MKKIIFVSILLFFSIQGKSQEKDNKLDMNSMKYFNEEQFNDWEKAGDFSKEEKRLKKGDKKVYILKYKDILNINISSINNAFTERYAYSPKTKVCITYIKEFKSTMLVLKKYDEQGNLIEEKNYEKMYKISIEKLIEIAKEKLSIDLNLPGPPNVHRYDYDEKRTPVYVITIVYYNGFGRTISIDANTGEILFDKEIGGGDEFIIEYNSEDHYINEYYPLKKKRTSKSKTTKTPKTTSFNGKTYTEEEWKAFEQEQWEKYQANRNKKSFWDKLFG